MSMNDEQTETLLSEIEEVAPKPDSEPRSQILSIHSFRGGTGKSNTTANLAASIARRGKRVCVIDTDIQSPGIHALFGCAPDSFDHTLNDYLWGRCRIDEAAIDVSSVLGEQDEDASGKLFFVPSALNAGEIARIIKEGFDVAQLSEGFHKLIESLELDYLLIDTHPGVNQETLLSIAFSDVFVLVLRPDTQDFQGTSVTIELARKLGVTDIAVIINKVPPGVDHGALIARVEKAYGARVAALLPMSHSVARMASANLMVVQQPDHPFSRGLKGLADRVLSGVTV